MLNCGYKTEEQQLFSQLELPVKEREQ